MPLNPIMKMSGLVGKRLFQRSACRMYPARPAHRYPATRGQVLFDAATCVYCGLCARKCPTGAIVTDRESKAWTLDRLLCIQCAECVAVCPKKSLRMDPAYPPPQTADPLAKKRKDSASPAGGVVSMARKESN